MLLLTYPDPDHHTVSSLHMHLVTQSTRHKWAQNITKPPIVIICSSDKYHLQTVLNTDGVITASDRTTRHFKHCHGVTGTASDLVDMWSLLRPTSLQPCEPQWPSNYSTATANMHLRCGKKGAIAHTCSKWRVIAVCVISQSMTTTISVLHKAVLYSFT